MVEYMLHEIVEEYMYKEKPKQRCKADKFNTSIAARKEIENI